MLLAHFFRRATETLFLDKQAALTLYTLKDAFWHAFMYVGVLGLLVGYSLFHTEYFASALLADEEGATLVVWLVYLLFGVAEAMNALC